MKSATRLLAIIAPLLLSGAAPAKAAWISIYDFEQAGSPYSVVVTSSADSLNDLFLDGYSGFDLSSFGSIEAALDVGTQTSTGAIQNHLVFAMLGQSGYGPLTNPGNIFMVYNDDTDYRYLDAGFTTGITEDEVFDTDAAELASQGFVVNQGSLLPEPSTGLLLAVGLFQLTRRHRLR